MNFTLLTFVFSIFFVVYFACFCFFMASAGERRGNCKNYKTINVHSKCLVYSKKEQQQRKKKREIRLVVLNNKVFIFYY